MRLHCDFAQRVVVATTELPWTASPAPGVQRRLLERDGDEIARATSIVRYEPGSRFAPHRHGLGEEFYVLDGTFADEHGRYPRGSYVRNPPGSAHAPYTDDGCVLFVKLRQLAPDDQRRVAIDTLQATWLKGPADGIDVLPLGSFGAERTRLERARPHACWPAHEHPGGEEVLVLDGAFADEHGRYAAGTWLRLPPGSRHRPASDEGCTLLVKSGHLPP